MAQFFAKWGSSLVLHSTLPLNFRSLEPKETRYAVSFSSSDVVHASSLKRPFVRARCQGAVRAPGYGTLERSRCGVGAKEARGMEACGLFGWGGNDRLRSWIITAGWFGVREKYCSGLKFTIVYDQANKLLKNTRGSFQEDNIWWWPLIN